MERNWKEGLGTLSTGEANGGAGTRTGRSKMLKR